MGEIIPPFCASALQAIIEGDPRKLRGAFKHHSNIDVDEQIKLVVDYQPKLGEVVETRRERVKKVVERDYHEEEEEDIYGRNLAAMKEWSSKVYSAPSKQVTVTIKKTDVVEWIEAIVVKISVDKMYFDLKDPQTEKIKKRVWRGIIRKLGSDTPLLTEPYMRMGSLKRKHNAIIPVAKYFRSMRKDDEETDGGGVYGRNVSLPHYHAHKLIGCVGDSLIHLIFKNSHIEERQGLLDVLMLLDSFTEESLNLENISNRTPMEEMNPPYFFKIPLLTYSYNAKVRWRAMKEQMLLNIHEKVDPKLGKLINDIAATPEDYDTSLKAWNQRALCWEAKEDTPEEIQLLPKSLSFLQPDSELLEVITTSFVDAGRYRGVLVGHRRHALLEVPLPEGAKPSAEDNFQAAIKCVQLCVEWDPPPVPVPRWRILPNLEDNSVKRRKWYNGYTFFKEHPLTVRTYMSAVADREVKLEKQSLEEEKKQQAKDALKKRATLIGVHRRKTMVEQGKTELQEDGVAVVVLGPVSRSDARCYPPLVDMPKEMLVLRKAEEKPFLDDWQYEVFTPESLTDISTTLGKSSTKDAPSLDWFTKELAHLRALKQGSNSQTNKTTAQLALDQPGRWAE